MNKILILLFILMPGFCNDCCAQQFMIGLYRDKGQEKPGDWHWEKQQVSGDADFKEKAAEFTIQHPGARTWHAKQGTSLIVVEYRAQLYQDDKNKYNKVEVIKGKTLQQARDQNEEMYKRYRGLYATKPSEVYFYGIEK